MQVDSPIGSFVNSSIRQFSYFHILTFVMTILGIDTSIRSTGYGVLSVEGSRMRMLDCGNIPNILPFEHF